MKNYLLIAAAVVFGLLATLGMIAAVAAVIVHVNHADTCAHGCCEGQCSPNCPCGVNPFAPRGPSGYPNCIPGTPGCCPPGGNCPTGSYGFEIGDKESSTVNRAALNEQKNGPPCLPCLKRPTTSQAAPHIAPMLPAKPQATSQPQALTNATSESKEGVFACLRCKRPTVGQQWHELWTDDGTSMLCLCETCWQSASMTERKQYLEKHAADSGLTTSQRFYVDALVAEATR